MTLARISFIVLALCLLTFSSPIVLDANAAKPNPVVVMETSMGRIILQLYADKAPITVKNFMRYVDAGYYNGTIFHRIIRQETKEKPRQGMNVVQGGGFNYPMLPKRPMWGPIPNEQANGLENTRGTISMARTNNPNSATSQFFINVYDNSALNPAFKANSMGKRTVIRHGYCVFGRVLRGMNVVEEMLKAKTGKRGMHSDVPLKPIYIKKAYRAQ